MKSKPMPKDPVCKTPVAAATALYEKHAGKIYYFCSYFCRHEFLLRASEPAARKSL